MSERSSSHGPEHTASKRASHLRETARELVGAGLCVLPALRDAAGKRVALSSWKEFQKRRPSLDELDGWFAKRTDALCLVCGAISGNLETIDFDVGGEAFELWRRTVEDLAPGLIERLVIETTPSGGRHVVYRCEGSVGCNAKLAIRRVETAGPDPVEIGGKRHTPRKETDGQWFASATLIETRGEGGMFLCAPSDGYTLIQGDLRSVPTITVDERDILLGCAKALDQSPSGVVAGPSGTVSPMAGNLRPGDDFNARGDIRAVLRKHGWNRCRSGENEHWTRPGKDSGTSATLKDRVFFNFTSNAPPFEPQSAYTPFAVFALLEHQGDFSAAASALRHEGYGSPAQGSPPTGSSAIAPGDGEGEIELGQRDPATGKLVLDPRRTLPTAEAFVRDFHSHREGRTLHDYGGVLMEWRDNRYCPVEDGAIKNILQRCLHDALRYAWNPRARRMELLDFQSNPTTVNHALESIRTLSHLPSTIKSPSWLDGGDGRPAAIDILPCRTMSLHIPTGQILAPTPALFTTNALDFDYDPEAEPPERWIKLLEQLFGDDIESVELLQEWMGYCLTGDTSQQKMLLVVGPRRAGKGTLGRIITQLVGRANVAGPTIGSLTGNFGLQPLIGKSLAIVSDARFAGQNMPIVIERILSISGEDSLSINRKFLPAVEMKLPTRFIFLTNELPRLVDASTALAGRFLVLRLQTSFYGKEDITLGDQLTQELPGILCWALDGRRRLTERGRFVQPSGAADTIQDMEDLGSPVSAFVRERCIVGPNQRTSTKGLFHAWVAWCAQEGRDFVGTKASFGRDLAAAFPGVHRRRSTSQTGFYDGIGLRGAES